jgi:iron(III) transport system ATP-binding protein
VLEGLFVIEVKSLVKIYADGDNAGVKAVDDISFTVEEGRFYTLLGPSGCGKTTTLRCIAGLEKANDGEILVAGSKVFSASDGTFVAAYRRPIGMVFQSYAIWPHLTVFENVAFPLRVGKQRISSADIRKKVADALGQVELGGYGNGWRRSCPAVSSSGWRWPERWCANRRCFCSMSR